MGFYSGAMPRGDYYNRAAGDYYSHRGDIFSKAKKSLKKAVKKVAKIAVPLATSAIPGGGLISSFLPQAGGTLSTIFGNAARSAANSALDRGIASLTGGGSTYVPEAVNNPVVPDFLEKMWDGVPRKRRTMNPGNAKALRRALSRVESFRTLVKKSGCMPAVRRVPQQRGCKTSSCTTCK